MDRRMFLAGGGIAAAHSLLPAASPPTPALGLGMSPDRFDGLCRDLASHPGDARSLAADDDFWAQVGQAFTVDRSMIHLNNGGVSPAPITVQRAMQRHLDFCNHAPSYHMWRVLEPGVEGVRQRLARMHGVDTEEIAITRNASESLMVALFGQDLQPGDEVLTTDQDYPRMLQTLHQRARREGIKVVELQVPVPCHSDAQLVELFRNAITDKTRLILCSHIINLSGQALPVTEITRLGREKGIPVVVDGAHSHVHLDFRLADLDVDYFGTSLHKWLFAPIGTGMLYVRRDKIRDLWPLLAADESLDDDIRKFEQVGTHPAANKLAVAEAITFHESLGMERKLARLLWLRDRWVNALTEAFPDRVHLRTSMKPGMAGGIANVDIEGIPAGKLSSHLWRKHRIHTVAIGHPDVRGQRISPSVYTTATEIDRFVDAMAAVIRDGLPG